MDTAMRLRSNQASSDDNPDAVWLGITAIRSKVTEHGFGKSNPLYQEAL
jgi:hypothetical protein